MSADELEVKLVPQGTLVEQIRAAGAGLGNFDSNWDWNDCGGRQAEACSQWYRISSGTPCSR